jgi:hypothetical protein
VNPRWGSTPRFTDWLTVNRNVTLTLTFDRRIETAVLLLFLYSLPWECWWTFLYCYRNGPYVTVLFSLLLIKSETTSIFHSLLIFSFCSCYLGTATSHTHTNIYTKDGCFLTYESSGYLSYLPFTILSCSTFHCVWQYTTCRNQPTDSLTRKFWQIYRHVNDGFSVRYNFLLLLPLSLSA